MNAAGVLPNFTGIAVHDAWPPYDTYQQITHSLCNAHVLRELIAVTDYHLAHATEKDSWCWAGKIIDNLLAIKKLTGAGPVLVDPERLARHRSLIVHAARIGLIDSPLGKVGNKHRALARRINNRIQDYLRFATDLRRASITMPRNGRFAWPSCAKKYPVACVPRALGIKR